MEYLFCLRHNSSEILSYFEEDGLSYYGMTSAVPVTKNKVKHKKEFGNLTGS